MNKTPRVKDDESETRPTVETYKPACERPVDEVRYGRLWAEVELPKLLTEKELKTEVHKP